MQDTVLVFDTTCRDGKQAPGNNHSPEDTVRIAKQAAHLGVSVFEAGFAASSDADFESVSRVAKEVAGITVCSLARAHIVDIQTTARAFDKALRSPRLHTFIATSDIHLEHKLKLSRDQALAKAVQSVELACSYCEDVQFSAEDATRTDFEYLKVVVREVILAGARTINLPDTVGYALPSEIESMVTQVITQVPEVAEYNVVISVHCHNDLGFATANTLAGIQAGARQVECTINGIGERAGNTHYAEVVMALQTRASHFGVEHSINLSEIGNTARLVSSIVKKPIPDTLPIVGEHVFAHGAGIHQHGVLSHSSVYEIMSPGSVGWQAEQFPLSSQSGRHGLQQRLSILGYAVSSNQLDSVYQDFLLIANTKVLVTNADLYSLIKASNK
jgi:2-isopropylmalate synthase